MTNQILDQELFLEQTRKKKDKRPKFLQVFIDCEREIKHKTSCRTGKAVQAVFKEAIKQADKTADDFNKSQLSGQTDATKLDM